jgi:rod shape-determining protein MreC
VREGRYLIWLLVLGAVLLLNLPLPLSMRIESGARDGFAPFQNFMTLAWYRLGGLVSLHRADAIQAERRAQLAELAALRERVRQLEGFELENQVLRRQLGFTILSTHRLLLCEVVARGDLSGWWRTIRLGKGSTDGIRAGLAVTSGDGLVGRVHAVSRYTCDVLLLTDPNCRIAARCRRTGAHGIVTGAGIRMTHTVPLEMLAAVRPCVMDYVPRAQALEPGDEIVTSGLGGVFPEGLRVGQVVAAETDVSGLYQRADVRPLAPLDTLKYAFIVME